MKVISFSIFGNDPTYTCGAIENADICSKLYPGWTCLFYIGRSVPACIVRELTARPNVKVVSRADLVEDWFATMWRFDALRNKTASHFIFRDTDSRPDIRERSAVDEWIVTGLDFHIMRDHPAHGTAILAGLWGCTQAGAAKIRHLLPVQFPTNMKWYDQHWLGSHVYPIARTSVMVHDATFEYEPKGEFHSIRKRFPTKRVPGRFVGQGFTADNQLRLPHDALKVRFE